MLSSVWSVVGSGLIAALLVTAGVYVLGLGEGLLGGSRVSRRVSSGGHYDGQHHYGGHYGGQYQDRWGRRQEGVGQQLAKIMAALSVDSVQVTITLTIASGVRIILMNVTGSCVRGKARHPRAPLLSER